MNRYYGGEPVAKGVYLNLSTLELVQAYGDAPILPGERDARYIRAPVPLAALAGPFAGLAFILFLPLVGIIGMISFLVYKAMKLMRITGGTGGADNNKLKNNPTEQNHVNRELTEIEQRLARRSDSGER